MSKRIDPRLFEAIATKSGLGKARIYELISECEIKYLIPKRIAALAVARNFNVNITRFADAADQQTLRGALGIGSAPVPQVASPITQSQPAKARAQSVRAPKTAGTSKAVWVVHGRDDRLRKDIFAFLRSIGLNPMEWSKALKDTKKASPYIGDILDKAFSRAAAVVVLLIGEDIAQIRPEYLRNDDEEFEKTLTPQPRPNVLFEAGRAFGSHPGRTVLVSVGRIRPISDLSGLHIVRLNNSPERRREFADRLSSAGCDVDLTGTDWMSEGSFET